VLHSDKPEDLYYREQYDESKTEKTENNVQSGANSEGNGEDAQNIKSDNNYFEVPDFLQGEKDIKIIK
jgi:hypothetical protein